MSDALINLLPAIYRIRDLERGGPLRELLEVIEDQVAVLEEDLAQLYDDQFIETCADWVVPYIGDLIGYRSLHHQASAASAPRAEVANTIGHRRRRGTVAMLEQLAHDVTGWPAKVVEFFQLLQTTQFMNHIRRHSTLTPDLRRWDAMEALDGPFDTTAHSVDTRSITAGEGRHNIPNIGIFLWRLGAHGLTDSPAVGLDAQRFLFSPLANNTPLFTRPDSEPTVTHLATHLNVPAPISRRRIFESLKEQKTKADYYGPGRSVFIQGIGVDDVMICDLSDDAGGWAHTPPPTGKVAIDPALGRIAFGDAQSSPPLVTFHSGFSADIGGGEYERAATFDLPAEPVDLVSAPATIQQAITNRTPGRALEITDNGRYAETLQLAVNAGERFELRAANGHRPAIVLGGDLVISGGDEQAEVSLNGLLLIGGTVRVSGTLRRLRLRHCTLVPGLALDTNSVPLAANAGEPGLVVEQGGISVEIDHCILGGVRWQELSRLDIRDSIVDATSDAGVALAGGDGLEAAGELAPSGGTLRLEECTVIGKVRARLMELVSNSIFAARTEAGDGWPAPILAERKQSGCVRFSFVPDGSRTPRRYRCQPDLEVATQTDTAAKKAQAQNQPFTSAERATIRADVLTWMKPAFTSVRYGHPAYAQLRARSPRQIREGADDEAAMGAFHDLFEPQRLTNLRIRLEEYLRFGLEAGVITAT
jgi:hypothetical protein